jgi:hypothetical protein
VAALAEIPTYALRAPPEPRPADVSSSAIERLRSTLPRPDRMVPEAEGVPLSPNGNPSHQSAETPPEPNPRPMRPGSSEIEPARQPRLDFLFRSRPARTEQPESFDSLWPKRSSSQREAPPQGEDAPTTPAVQAPSAAEAAPVEENLITPETVAVPMMNEPPSVAILKSGVVDGMAYTLYADGSIEAQMPQGTVRFGSITELRAHIENNS